MPVYNLDFFQFILLTFHLLVSMSVAQADVKPYTCQVKEVINGTTIKCDDGSLVRIWGIEVQETKNNEAKEYLRSYVDNQKLKCQYKGLLEGGIIGQCIKDLKVKQIDIADPLLIGDYATEDMEMTKGFYSNPDRPRSH